MVAFILVLRLFLWYILDYLISELFILFDKQRHLAGNFWSVSCRLCWIFKLWLGFPYLLVYRFSLAYCRAICFFALVEIWFMNAFSEHLSLFFICFRFILRLLMFNNFFFIVSAILVGVSDRLAGLLNRLWWRGWDWMMALMETFLMVPLWVSIGNRSWMSGFCSVMVSIKIVGRT